VIDELVLIWAASYADEWKDRIVNIPQHATGAGSVREGDNS